MKTSATNPPLWVVIGSNTAHLFTKQGDNLAGYLTPTFVYDMFRSHLDSLFCHKGITWDHCLSLDTIMMDGWSSPSTMTGNEKKSDSNAIECLANSTPFRQRKKTQGFKAPACGTKKWPARNGSDQQVNQQEVPK